ncbi:hypothetical protein PROFUN_04625 [Planoprotostelium fungivorum]|uniref:CFA20 domain-containing protein n=1 Tax=Planoprotostelium fungivorum TaxID=1890364 RepID=A0A2P6NUR2_9EUKA|nr:hypothetical protein PROFUN_04625 [Planoprotostelium fungivorum]
MRNVRTKPLELWDIHGPVLEILAKEEKGIITNYITSPADPTKTLSLKLPFLVLQMKNMNSPFSLEITTIDDKRQERRFRISTFQRKPKVTSQLCALPCYLSLGWNHLVIDLNQLSTRAYNSGHVETNDIQIHGNCRLRRVYFSDKMYAEEDLSPEFTLFATDISNTRKKEEDEGVTTFPLFQKPNNSSKR